MKILSSAFPSLILFSIILLSWDFVTVAPVAPSNVPSNMFCDCQLDIGESINLQLGDSFRMEPLFSCPPNQVENFTWSPVDYLSCTDCINPYVRPLQDKCYTLSVEWTDGCISTDEICVFVTPCESVPVDNVINSISPAQIGDEATIELTVARTQYVHIEIVEDDEVQYVIWEGFLKAGLRTRTLDFSAVPSGNHQLRARFYPEDKFIDIVKL